MTAAHQAQGSWACCWHLVVIEEDEKWQKTAGRWIQLDSESSDMRLGKAGGDGADSQASKLPS